MYLGLDWARLRNAVYVATLEVIGPTTSKHQDWLDHNNCQIQILLEEKHPILQAFLNDLTSLSKKEAFSVAKRKVQSEVHLVQDEWLSKQTDTIQAYAERKDMKNFYSALKDVRGPKSTRSSHLLSPDGTALISERRLSQEAKTH